MKVSLIQYAADIDISANLALAERLIEAAIAADRPELVVLPEAFTQIGASPAERFAAADAVPDGPACRMLTGLAARHGVAIHGGSLFEQGEDGRCWNTTIVVDSAGALLATYRKIHLFDVTAPDGRVYRESDGIAPGEDLALYDLAGLRFGCAICYDVRFPELFQRLARQGADAFVLPSVFTLQTGKDHWEPLLRARAIENGAWMIAPGQSGLHPTSKRQSWGHSMVVDPWGTIVAQASDGEGWVTATIDRARVENARRMIPTHRHHRLIEPWGT